MHVARCGMLASILNIERDQIYSGTKGAHKAACMSRTHSVPTVVHML